MSEKKFGIAIIGYGGMGGWHTQTIAKIPEVMLCGVYDIREERNQLAQENDIVAFSSYEELLEDSNVHLVTIATPNDTHLKLAIQAMNAGKHVVCEKPVAMNSKELEEMIHCSKKNQVLFTVHQNRRWDEDYLVLKNMYDHNLLGSAFNIESRVHGSRGIPGDWRNKKEHGGGMVLDWGVHLIDQIMMMLQEKKLVSLYAQLSFVTNEGVDDGFRALLNFEDAIKVLIEVGTSNFINLPRWYIQGENGSAIIQDWDCNGEIIKVSDWENRDAVPVVTAAGLTKTMAPRTEETIKHYPLPREESDIRDFYRNIKLATEGKSELIVKPEEVMQVMKVMEAIFKSSEENCVITF